MALNITVSGGSLDIVSVANTAVVVFRGEGLDDGTSGGAYTGTIQQDYEIVVDLAAGTDTFKWRRTGQDFVESVAMTGGAQTLDSGVTITFAATTGHTLYDRWTIKATAPDNQLNHKVSTANIRDWIISEDGNSTGIIDVSKDTPLMIDYRNVLIPAATTSGTDLRDKLIVLISDDNGTSTPTAGDDVTFQLTAATTTEVLAADPKRIGASITNNSDQVVQISYGEAASLTSFSVALDPRTASGQPVHYLEIPSWAVKGDIDAFSVLEMTGDDNLLVNDVTS